MSSINNIKAGLQSRIGVHAGHFRRTENVTARRNMRFGMGSPMSGSTPEYPKAQTAPKNKAPNEQTRKNGLGPAGGPFGPAEFDRQLSIQFALFAM